jgi:hypothetical protein
MKYETMVWYLCEIMVWYGIYVCIVGVGYYWSVIIQGWKGASLRHLLGDFLCLLK